MNNPRRTGYRAGIDVAGWTPAPPSWHLRLWLWGIRVFQWTVKAVILMVVAWAVAWLWTGGELMQGGVMALVVILLLAIINQMPWRRQ